MLFATLLLVVVSRVMLDLGGGIGFFFLREFKTLFELVVLSLLNALIFGVSNAGLVVNVLLLLLIGVDVLENSDIAASRSEELKL